MSAIETPASPEAIDLDAYFGRIGYDGPRTPTLSTLEGIVAGHVRSIPFENVDALLGRPVRLDASSVFEKLVLRRRGGYCFEQNALLLAVLEALGYRAHGLAARVLWSQPEGEIAPRHHMLLHVDVQGSSFLADVGFGGVTPSAPILLAPGVEQPTPHEPVRLVSKEGEYDLQTLIAGVWQPVYRFDLQRQAPVDYLAANWWISTSPDSIFTKNLLVSRAGDGVRYVCANGDLAVYRSARPPEKREIRDLAALRETLAETFQLGVDDAEADALYEAVRPRLGQRPF